MQHFNSQVSGYLKSIFVLSQVSHRCLQHALQRGLVFFPTPFAVSQHLLVLSEGSPTTCAPRNRPTGDFTALKAFSKQIWTCSEPSSSIHKSCQACWPTCTMVLMTAPASGSKLACIQPAQDGKEPCSDGPVTTGHRHTARASTSSVPMPPPKVPPGPIFTKKRDAFNNVQPSFYSFNVVKVILARIYTSGCTLSLHTPYVSLCKIQGNQHLLTPSFSKKAHSCYCRRGLHGLGGKKREVVVLHLAEVGMIFPADTNPVFFSFSTAPSSAFSKSWKCMVCDCLSTDQLRVSPKGRMYSVQLQAVEHSTSIQLARVNVTLHRSPPVLRTKRSTGDIPHLDSQAGSWDLLSLD